MRSRGAHIASSSCTPVSGIVALLRLAGIYLIVLGVLRIIAGFAIPAEVAAA